MEGLAGWLAGIAWPIVSRVLVALGVGYVTYEGADTVLEQALTAAKQAWAGVLADVAALLAMAGFFDYMAITSGGLVGGLAWMTMKRFTVSASQGSGGGAA